MEVKREMEWKVEKEKRKTAGHFITARLPSTERGQKGMTALARDMIKLE